MLHIQQLGLLILSPNKNKTYLLFMILKCVCFRTFLFGYLYHIYIYLYLIHCIYYIYRFISYLSNLRPISLHYCFVLFPMWILVPRTVPACNRKCSFGADENDPKPMIPPVGPKKIVYVLVISHIILLVF